MFVSERFVAYIIKIYGKHPISTDGGTWYPMACRFGLKHHIHSSFAKRRGIIERTMQYIKDRTKNFDYFPCRLKNCKMNHVRNWLRLFVFYHNRENLLNEEPVFDIYQKCH